MAPLIRHYTSILVCIAILCSTLASSLKIPTRISATQSKNVRPVAKRDDTSSDSSSLDACGSLIDKYNNDGATQFSAREVYECLKIVPFDETIAKGYVDYLRTTFEFQSTLAYLKDPPTSYQQPAVALLEGFDQIKDNIQTGVYDSEYAFEADVLRLLYAAHDGHISVDTGLLYSFTFGSPVSIVSTSADGKELPKPYLSSDVIGNDGSFAPSAIQAINGQDATTFLKRYAELHSTGMIESHSDWNLLMDSPALQIQNAASSFTISSPFYPGDLLNIVLENGTALPEMEFQANINLNVFNDPGCIKNAQDFYNFFVIVSDFFCDDPGDDSSSTDDGSDDSSDADDSSTSSDSPTSTTDSGNSTTSSSALGASSTSDDGGDDTDDDNDSDDDDDDNDDSDSLANDWLDVTGVSGYPTQPDVSQPNLGSGGWITGYFLNATATGIISIPSFEVSSGSLESFSDTLGTFLDRSKQAGMKRIVVDLQQNGGGDELLAIDAFKHFFPNLEITGGSRLRAFDKSNVLGATITNYFQNFVDDPNYANSSYREALVDDPWAVLNYINPRTGRYFGSWSEFYGPVEDHGDSFSTTSQFNFSDTRFDQAATQNDPNEEADDADSDDDESSPGIGFIPYGFANRSTSNPAPYEAKDIMLLTDGLCSSTCAMFAELMHQAGVRKVTVGGLPQPGPIQAIGGNRGAQIYTSFDLDPDISVAITLNSTANYTLPADRDSLNFTVNEITFNLRDQVRENQNLPLQFAYDAADCRIFWTLTSLNNYTDLWSRGAAALWDDNSLCVAESTGYASVDTNMNGPPADSIKAWNNGQTIAEAQASLAALYNNTIPDTAYDSSSLDGWIMGGLGGIDDRFPTVGSGPGSGSHGGSIFGSTLDDKCRPYSNDCGSDQLCVKSVACGDDGEYDIKVPFRCKRKCSSKNKCGSIGKSHYCNDREYSCVKKRCNPLGKSNSFCEPSTNGLNCKRKALEAAQQQIQNKGLSEHFVFNVPENGL